MNTKLKSSPAATKAGRVSIRKEQILPYILIVPAFFVFVYFMFYPLVQTVYYSFLDWNMVSLNKEFVGLENYIRLFTNPDTLRVVGNTFVYIGILLVFNFAAPYLFSFVLSVVIRRGKNFYKSAIFLPSVISLMVGTMIFVWILNPLSGPAARLVQFLGFEMPVWSQQGALSMLVISLITSWKVFGYNFIVVLGGVAGVSQEVIESARLAGIPTWRIFWDIVLPMSSATGVYVLIITIVQGLQNVFTPIKALSPGGPELTKSNLIFHVYNEAFGLFQTGSASAYSIVTMVLFAVLLFLEFKFVERGIYYEN